MRNTEDFDVKYKDTAIESVLEVKYLGIKIDKTLSGEGTLDTIIKKCTGRVKIFVQIGRMLTKGCKEDPVPVACTVSSELCCIVLVCCNDTKSQTQIANCSEQKLNKNYKFFRTNWLDLS